MPFSIEAFAIDPADPAFEDLARPIAECDRYVFGESEEWSEGKRCPSCSRPGRDLKWTFSAAPPECPRCGGELVDCWPLERLIADMRDVLLQEGCVFLVARDGKQVIGAYRCFVAAIREVAERAHRDLDPGGVDGLVARLSERFPGASRFVWQDSLLVHPNFRKQGVARDLAYEGHTRLLAVGADAYVTRTSPRAHTYQWCLAAGYEIVLELGDVDERVVLTRRTELRTP